MTEAMRALGRFLTSPRGLLLGVYVLVFLVFFALGGREWLSLEGFRAHRNQLLEYTTRHFWSFLLAWGGIYMATIAFSLPGGALLSLVTGFLFGRWWGTVLIVVSATLGAVTVFVAARYIFANATRGRLPQNPAVARLLAGFDRNAVSYLLFLRLVPVFPFWLVNLAPAFTPVSLRTYLWTTVVGIAPGCFVFANLGRSLGELDSLKGLMSPQVIVSLALLGGLALLSVWLRPWARRFGLTHLGEKS